MVVTAPEHTSTGSGSPKRLTVSFLTSLSAFINLWAKRASRASTKLKPHKPTNASDHCEIPKKAPKSPLITKPKELFSQISNKAITLVNHNKRKESHEDSVYSDDFDFGDGGVWQRSILMGDKCQPLDFSGAIYYDSNGKKLNEAPPPRSPRASPLPSYLMNRG